MNETKINWTELSWNPASGCNEVSKACDRCYAKVIAEKYRGTPAFPNGFDVMVRPWKLNEPAKVKRPSLIFTNSMTDMFHLGIADDEASSRSALALRARRGDARDRGGAQCGGVESLGDAAPYRGDGAAGVDVSARNVRWLEERQDRAYDLAHRLLRAARRVSDGAIGWGDTSAAQEQRAKLNALCDRAIAVRQAGDRYGRAARCA